MDSCTINKSIYSSLPRFGHQPSKPVHHVLWFLLIENRCVLYQCDRSNTLVLAIATDIQYLSYNMLTVACCSWCWASWTNIWGEPEWAPHWSWQQPAHVYMYVCMYVCMYYVFNIFDVLACVIYNWTARTTSYSLLALKIIHKESRTGKWTHRHMVLTDSSYWDSGAAAARQLANAPVWLRNNQWSARLYWCYVSFIST